jgi:hypothetical protein
VLKVADAAKSAIVVHRAREHNLRDVDVAIPRDGMTVVTGVSGRDLPAMVDALKDRVGSGAVLVVADTGGKAGQPLTGRDGVRFGPGVDLGQAHPGHACA